MSNRSFLRATRRTAPVAALVLALGALSLSSPVQAQGSSAAVHCRVSFDSLEVRIRRSYAGYRLEVATQRAGEYAALVEQTTRAAVAAGFETAPCTAALQGYLAWFNDPHLFLFQRTLGDTAANRARERAIVRDTRTAADLRTELERRRESLDPIEGIWREGALRVGIIRKDAASDTLLAIILESDTAAWPVGAVRAQFVPNADGSYRATLLARNFGLQHLTATIHRRSLLRFSPGMWGKEWPLHPGDLATAPAADPRLPRLALRERSVVISLPSHDGGYMRTIDSLVALHQDAMRSTRLIIVDLRGNEGGSSLTSRSIHPFLVSEGRRPTPYDSGTPVMLASSDLVDHTRRMGGANLTRAERRLLERLDASPDQFVPAYEPGTPLLPSATPLDGSWTVAVLTDRGTVSAAEVTVLMALRSTRAVVIGEPTAGALDYQTVGLLSLATGDRRWALGIPTVAAHTDLPARGMRGKGIPPQVPLAWSTVEDPYAAVERILLDRARP